MTSKRSDSTKDARKKTKKQSGLVAWLNQEVDLFDPWTWFDARGIESKKRH